MSMSNIELASYLKKQLGLILKRLEETGVVAVPAATDHAFIPEIVVPDSGMVLPIHGFLYSISVDKDSQPCKFNLDRPVTQTEYSIIYPGTVKKIWRLASNLYLKAPSGQTSKITVEVLKGG